jgi:hypothetical protein
VPCILLCLSLHNAQLTSPFFFTARVHSWSVSSRGTVVVCDWPTQVPSGQLVATGKARAVQRGWWGCPWAYSRSPMLTLLFWGSGASGSLLTNGHFFLKVLFQVSDSLALCVLYL